MDAMRRLMMRNKGFTLIELLMVIVVIAILATIAIPTYLGQRQKAQDSACFTLVRNALTAVQTALVDTGDYTGITAPMLQNIETGIHFVDNGKDLVSTLPPGVSAAVEAKTSDSRVAFHADSATQFDLASRSESGNWFGIQVNTLNLDKTGYVKVRVVDGSAAIGW